MLTDTHCHILKEYYDDIDAIINNAIENGVTRFINCGYNRDTIKEVIELSNIKDDVYSVIGIHPHEVDNATEEDFKLIEDNLSNPKVIAIGEIGLDFHYGRENEELQYEWFERQLKLAEKLNIPVVVHSRKATKETLDTIKKYKVKGVMHCFSGNAEIAREYIKLGFLLGINGVVTFGEGKANKMEEVVKAIDPSYIVLETDCPYLTPVPFRGKKNEPKNIKYIAEYVANLKRITVLELSEITNKNIVRIFDI